MTAAHAEVIPGIDWIIGVIGETLVAIGAIWIITVRNHCVNERQCYQAFEPLFDSQGGGRHCDVEADGVTEFEGERCESIAEEQLGQKHGAIPTSSNVALD